MYPMWTRKREVDQSLVDKDGRLVEDHIDNERPTEPVPSQEAAIVKTGT